MDNIFDPINQDFLMKSILKQVEDGLNEEADKLIESKVTKLREELVYQKNSSIAEVLNSIEILTQNDSFSGSINIQINIRPSRYIKVKD